MKAWFTENWPFVVLGFVMLSIAMPSMSGIEKQLKRIADLLEEAAKRNRS